MASWRAARFVGLPAVAFAASGLLLTACEPQRQPGGLSDRIFAAPSGTYYVKSLELNEWRAEKAYPEYTTGSLVAWARIEFVCKCKWSVVRRRSKRITVRETVTSYTLRTQLDNPDMRSDYFKKTGTTLPKEGLVETRDDWNGYILETKYAPWGEIVDQRIARPRPGVPAMANQDLAQYLENALAFPSYSPFRGGAQFGEPHLLNPVSLRIEWPAHPVQPGGEWAEGISTLYRLVALHEKNGTRHAHITWRKIELPSSTRPQNQPSGIGGTSPAVPNLTFVLIGGTPSSGTVILDTTRRRILDARWLETRRAHERPQFRPFIVSPMDVVRFSTSTVSIHWTYDD